MHRRVRSRSEKISAQHNTSPFGRAVSLGVVLHSIQSHVVKEYLDALAAALERVDLLGEAYLWRGIGRAVMGPRPR